MRKFKRCAYCKGRIWGTARLYVHMYGHDLVLQCWVHDNASPKHKGCDQLLTEAITKGYVDTKNIIEAVGPYLGFDNRKTEGVLVGIEKKDSA